MADTKKLTGSPSAGQPEQKKAQVYVEMGNPEAFSLYNKLNLVCFSIKLQAEEKNGSWKKAIVPKQRSWMPITTTSFLLGDNGYALRTGKEFNITAIDIDDPTLEHNQKLMELMSNCNMIAKTRKGFHYVFKYDKRISQTTSNDLALDTRNDGGFIFCEPTSIKAPTGETVAHYEWQVSPLDDEELQPLSDEAFAYMLTLDTRFGKEKKKKLILPTEAVEDDDFISDATDNPCTSVDSNNEEVLIKLLHALDTKRLDNYDDWLKVGMICHNEMIPLDVWDSISKKSKKYEAGACEKKWDSFARSNKKRLTQATLWKWLKADNPVAFYSLMESREDFWKLIQLVNHKDIAQYFYNNNPDSYLYNENLGWYSITSGNIWKQTDKNNPPNLKRHIADTLQELTMDTKKTELAKYAKKMMAITDKEKSDEEYKKHLATMRNINKAYTTFGSSDFCNGVISFLPSFYEVEDLEEKIDRNSYLFAFNDGVFDIKTCKFRPIQPTDYISTTTGYNYPKHSNTKTRKEIEVFLNSLFENDDTKNYLMKVLSSCLFGGNRWEQFYVLTGSGGNGKGVISTLLTNSFGNYYLSVDSSLFTKQSERKDQPIPALVDARNKHIMMTSEPENDNKLQIGQIKKMCGNDPVEARTLYSKHIFKYIPKYKVFIQTNYIPKLSQIDKAVERRMRIIEFPFVFVANPTLSHHRQGNPDVKEIFCKSNEWRDEFMLMLVETYITIKDSLSLEMPSSVIAKTSEYFDDNNPLKSWLEKNYTLTMKENDRIQSSILKRQYLQDTGKDGISDSAFKNLLSYNGIVQVKGRTAAFYKGLLRREEFQEDE